MSQKKAFDNIMNYFNEGDEEEEEEEEEESNYILNFDINQNTINKKKKNSSLKQVNSNLTINSSNEEKIVQNNLDNNYISYFGNDPSRPETPKLNCDNNNIEDEKEEKLIKLNNKENNSNNNEDISNNIFSETLETKIKNIDSNSVSILENTDNNFEYNETPNTRQTFRKDNNINDQKDNESENSQKDLVLNEQKEENKIEENKELDASKENINFDSFQMNQSFNKENIDENDKIIIENNFNNTNNNNSFCISNKYNNEIKKKKLFLELQKNKEKLMKLENANNNNKNSEEENIILSHNKKDTSSINNSNNINFINFNEIKEICKETTEKEKENIDEINEDKKCNKNNEDIIKKINADNIDELFMPILYNDNNIIKKNEKNKNKPRIKNKIRINKGKNNNNKKKLTKSKSLDSFNTKFKMDKLSYKKLSSFNEKLISKIITKYSENNKMISILGMLKSFNDLKVLHLLISNNEIDINKLKEIIDNLDDKEISKIKELEFLEQIWFLLNPNNKEMIKSEIFEGFIKLIYPYSINLKKNVIAYIKEYIKIVNFMEPKNDNKNNDEYCYSPLRQKDFSKDELWSIEKIVQTFFELKMNAIAYKNNHENLKKEKNINNNDNNINNNCNKKKEKRKNLNFDKIYDLFMMKKKIRDKTLEIMREEQIKENKEELEKYTYIPKICKKSEKLIKNYKGNNIPVYDKLYIKRNDKKKIIEKIKDKYDINNKKEESFTFKPEIIKNIDLKKQFEKNKIPKNCYKYIRKNIELIEKKKEEKIKEEEKYNGSNYEKVRKIKFNCEGNLYNKKKEIKQLKKKYDITVKIKLPNENDAIINVNLNDDIEKKVEDFCKIYSLNDNIKEKIFNQIKTHINLNK